MSFNLILPVVYTKTMEKGCNNRHAYFWILYWPRYKFGV